MADNYMEKALKDLNQEKELLLKWDPNNLAGIIKEVGFSCFLCGRCCTSPFNGHVFLLDADAVKAKEICPDGLIPAPEFELCDEAGSFYVSGYALRVNQDGACIHLKENRCLIYTDRFTICRIYPYMLHREYDSRKKLDFRQISGLNEHGEYNNQISESEAFSIAHETIAYELSWLNQMIAFYTSAILIFRDKNTRYIRKVYDTNIKGFREGRRIQVYVWYQNTFSQHNVRSNEYYGMGWP